MIKCLYCGYECPVTAHLCPNCGKPIVQMTVSTQPSFDNTKEALRREKAGKKTEPRSQNQIIIAACVVLLIAFAIYNLLKLN